MLCIENLFLLQYKNSILISFNNIMPCHPEEKCFQLHTAQKKQVLNKFSSHLSYIFCYMTIRDKTCITTINTHSSWIYL